MNMPKTSAILARRLHVALGMAAGLLFLPAAASAPATAQDMDLEKHFTGAKLTFIVGSPGGGADILMRASSQFIGDFLPGKPASITVQNIPGGRGVPQVRKFMAAKPDGYTVTSLHSRHTVDAILGAHPIKGWDPRRIGLIGSPTAGGQSRMMCVHPGTYKWTSWKDLLASGDVLNVASTEPSGGAAAMGARFIEMNGGPIRIISGYSSFGEIFAAYFRGEVPVIQHCVDRSVLKEYPELVKTPEEARKTFIPIVWWDKESSQDWLDTLGQSEPVPHMLDVLDLMGGDEEQKKTFRAAVEIRGNFSRLWALPEGTPEPIVEAWQEAFMNMTKSPEYEKRISELGFEDSHAPKSGKELRATFDLFDTLSPKSVEIIRELSQ